MEIFGFLLHYVFSHVTVEVIFAIILGYMLLTQKHSNERLFDKVSSNHIVMTNQLTDHIASEEKEFEGIDKKINIISSAMKMLQDTMQSLNSAMERYAITNHDVLDDEVGQIDAIIYMSATSVSNILKNMLVDVRKNGKDFTEKAIEELVEEITIDVEADRRKYHSELITKGVSTKTVSLWEETEREAFESFLYRIIQTFKKLVEMKGNGTVDKLIERECELLRDYMHTDFMKRLKRRMSVVK